MGELRDQLFLEFVNKSLDSVRKEYREKGEPKKDNRFLIKGITYEIGRCSLDDDGYFVFEISSKIPQDLLPKKVRIEKYFNSVVRIIKKASKKPSDWKMENIIRSTADEEFKERDYVKFLYKYKEKELFGPADIEKRMKLYQENKTSLPDIPGIATAGGKIVLVLVEESMGKLAKQNVADLIAANETVKKDIKTAAK
ncbi:hypothetical protein MNBD_NITROSPINAE02-1288 [hydrothermal vent metagenome]|uniref:Uncharacterized protein n=1 Tax=hydrothermal vent metagenome TaxID=652676 RepID=A0A3B1BCU0_9ZZZZ